MATFHAIGDKTKRSHRQFVEDKQADIVRPTPTTLTEQLIYDNTLESCETVRMVELLFISIADMPGLGACKRLSELTIMHARLSQMPSELQLIKGTLRRLSLANNEIEGIDHLHGMAKLHSLFLQENRITSFDGLDDIPGLQRLWLANNQIASDETLPVEKLGELRELWLQANPVEVLGTIPKLKNLQVLSLAGTQIRSLDQLAPLVGLPALFDLSFEDGFYGAAPVVDVPSYHASALRSLKQLGVLDGKTISERQRSDAEEEFLQRSLRFNVEVDRLKKEASHELATLDRERQSSAAGLRAMRTAHSRSVAQLQALVADGQGQIQAQQARFLKAHAQSRMELRHTLNEIKAEYLAETARLEAAEAERIQVCKRRLHALNARALAMAATRKAVAECEMAGEGRLFAEPIERHDPQHAYVRARAEAPPLGGPSAPGASAATIHMLCCYRLYRVPASAAAASAAASAAAAGLSTTIASSSTSSSSSSHTFHPGSRWSWWWHTAPLEKLLEAAMRWAPRDALSPTGHSLANSAARDDGDSSASGGGHGRKGWAATLKGGLSADESTPIDVATVKRLSADALLAKEGYVPPHARTGGAGATTSAPTANNAAAAAKAAGAARATAAEEAASMEAFGVPPLELGEEDAELEAISTKANQQHQAGGVMSNATPSAASVSSLSVSESLDGEGVGGGAPALMAAGSEEEADDDGTPRAQICAALLCRSSQDPMGASAMSGGGPGQYAGALAGTGVPPQTPSASALEAAAATAAPEYLVVYEVYPAGADLRSLLADFNDMAAFTAAAAPVIGGLGGGAASASHGASSGGEKGASSSSSKKGSKKAERVSGGGGGGAGGGADDHHLSAASSSLQDGSGVGAGGLPLSLRDDHQLLEALLGGDLAAPMPAPPPAPPSSLGSKSSAAAAGGVGGALAIGGGEPLGGDVAAAAKLAAEEEAYAVTAAVSRAQRTAAREASEHAVLLQLEKRADEAFRQHQYRVWQAAHPQTAASLDKASTRIEHLQTQLGQLYGQIRQEHAQQLSLRSQIESRQTNTAAAATARTESLLESALKTARKSIVAAAAAHDGSEGAAPEGHVEVS